MTIHSDHDGRRLVASKPGLYAVQGEAMYPSYPHRPHMAFGGPEEPPQGYAPYYGQHVAHGSPNSWGADAHGSDRGNGTSPLPPPGMHVVFNAGHNIHANGRAPMPMVPVASSSMLGVPAQPSGPVGGTSSTALDQAPTYLGHVKTTLDAILLLSACDLPSSASALSPASGMRTLATPPPRRVNRRLLDSERHSLIYSGAVFCWDEKEADMRRWTDGRCWSASRVSGCFLTYRELEARKKPANSGAQGPTQNQYKLDGLIKQSFSMTTTSGRKLHIVNYYTKRDLRDGRLRRVSEDPRFVGEGGGEWGLTVDEHEYPDPAQRLEEGIDAEPTEGSRGDSDTQEGGRSVSPASSSPDSATAGRSQARGGGERVARPTIRAQRLHGAAAGAANGRSTAQRTESVSHIHVRRRHTESTADVGPQTDGPSASAKRLLTEEEELELEDSRPSQRPRLGAHSLRTLSGSALASRHGFGEGRSLSSNDPRIRNIRNGGGCGSGSGSGSGSGIGSGGDSGGRSFQSTTSNATTVESNSRDSGDEKDRAPAATAVAVPAAVRKSPPPVVTGPTRTCESKVRATPMTSSRSEQESAVGALLSLRGDGASASVEAATGKVVGVDEPPGILPMATSAVPVRASSDRQALSLFSLRL